MQNSFEYSIAQLLAERMSEKVINEINPLGFYFIMQSEISDLTNLIYTSSPAIRNYLEYQCGIYDIGEFKTNFDQSNDNERRRVYEALELGFLKITDKICPPDFAKQLRYYHKNITGIEEKQFLIFMRN